MKDYSYWEPSSRLCWWVKYLRIVVWTCIIGYILIIGSIGLFGIGENMENSKYSDKIFGWMAFSILLCLLCIGRMGGYSKANSTNKLEPSVFYNYIMWFIIVLSPFIIGLYANSVSLITIILISIIILVGLIIGFNSSIPFYHYYKKYARKFIPRNMYWGKSQWQIDRMENTYARLQAWYPFRVIAVFCWITLGWILLPFINITVS